jgi:hypothetical protein
VREECHRVRFLPSSRLENPRESRTVLYLIASYLVLVLVLPAVLSVVVSYRAVPVGRACAHCGGDTIVLMHRWLRAVSRMNPLSTLQRRWCLECGWEGTVRLPRRRLRPAARRARARPTHTLELRWLTLEGRPWRVLLQYWHRTGRCYGRLVFIGPSGRRWLDAVGAFSGSSRRDVVGQALELPDGLLATRLRRSIRET